MNSPATRTAPWPLISSGFIDFANLRMPNRPDTATKSELSESMLGVVANFQAVYCDATGESLLRLRTICGLRFAIWRPRLGASFVAYMVQTVTGQSWLADNDLNIPANAQSVVAEMQEMGVEVTHWGTLQRNAIETLASKSHPNLTLHATRRAIRRMKLGLWRLMQGPDLIRAISQFSVPWQGTLLFAYLAIAPSKAVAQRRIEALHNVPILAAVVAGGGKWCSDKEVPAASRLVLQAVDKSNPLMNALASYLFGSGVSWSKSTMRWMNGAVAHQISHLRVSEKKFLVLASRLPGHSRPQNYVEYRNVRHLLQDMEIRQREMKALAAILDWPLPIGTLLGNLQKVTARAIRQELALLRSGRGVSIDWPADLGVATMQSAGAALFDVTTTGLALNLHALSWLKVGSYLDLTRRLSEITSEGDFNAAPRYRAAMHQRARHVWESLNVEITDQGVPVIPATVLHRHLDQNIRVRQLTSDSTIQEVGARLEVCLRHAKNSMSYADRTLRGESVLVEIISSASVGTETSIVEYQVDNGQIYLIQHRARRNAGASAMHLRVSNTLGLSLETLWLPRVKTGQLLLKEMFSLDERAEFRVAAIQAVLQEFGILSSSERLTSLQPPIQTATEIMDLEWVRIACNR